MFYDALSHFQHTFRVQQDSVALMSASQYSQVTLRWPRLSEQFFRVDKWSVCRG